MTVKTGGAPAPGAPLLPTPMSPDSFLYIVCYARDQLLFELILIHPNARSEWQFGIQATGGKLVGAILAAPKHIYIAEKIKVFIMPSIII